MRKPKPKKWTEAEIRALPDNELVGLSLNAAYPEEIQQLAMMHCRARQVKDRATIQPIDHAVIAQPHTPIYRMHRYFARRPWSVFNELILHYSNPGDIILDPFCGGGVTVVEGVRLGRKVIGVDMNPLATFVTRMEVATADAEELEGAFETIDAEARAGVAPLFRTRCGLCGENAVADWVEHSTAAPCPRCQETIVFAYAEKVKGERIGAAGGQYKCPHCHKLIRAPQERLRCDQMTTIKYACENCGKGGHKRPDQEDIELRERIETDLAHTVQAAGLLIPDQAIPDLDLQRENALYAKGITRFADLFTKRNLLANGLVKRAILAKACTEPVRRALAFTFSGSLRFTNKMVFRSEAWRPTTEAVEWAGNAYWIADTFLEVNPLWAFRNRRRAVLQGFKYAETTLPGRSEARSLADFASSSCTHLILTRSSHDLPFEDNSVDVVITDPPYGGNVQYGEVSDFYTVWLKDMAVLDGATLKNGLIDLTYEAVETRQKGFEGAKSVSHYRDMLLRVFRECHRVLKPDAWMVMTFHNREFKIWNAIHAAAHDAGFCMPERDGLIYQPPIKQYTRTIQQRRHGSMLGDFIISFQRASIQPEKQMIPEVEVGSKVRKVAQETVAYHGSASLSTIYMRLIPFLINNGLLDNIGEKDLVQFLAEDFETRVDEQGNERWYFKEVAAGEGSKEPLDFIPVEARIEYTIRSLLRQKRAASQDDILNAVYSQLINSNAAEYQEIQRVLARLCTLEPVKGRSRQMYMLREQAAARRMGSLFEQEQPELVQQEEGARAESEHDLVIEDLARLGMNRSYELHIGKTEQAKYTRFRQWSRAMTYPAEFGIHPDAFDKITQIDTLWLRGQAVVSAFEVEKSTTIDSGIDRFRNLFAALPNLQVPAYLVVPDDREEETRRKLGSLANRRDSLTTKVRYLVFSDIMGKPSVNLESVARQVA